MGLLIYTRRKKVTKKDTALMLYSAKKVVTEPAGAL
jgi:hypothetical protein